MQSLVNNHGFPIDKDKIKLISKKLFAVKEANSKYLNVKSIYNYHLKYFLKELFNEENSNEEDVNESKEQKEKENKETDSLCISWDIILTLFDNIIIVKAKAHTYYELTIKKSGKLNNIKIIKSNDGSNKDDNESKDKKENQKNHYLL